MMLTGGLPMITASNGPLLKCLILLRELLRILHFSLVLTHNPQVGV
jgi:hypothetical protein